MLPQHDPLFMQAAADHEDRKKVEGAKKRKKKTFPKLLDEIATLWTAKR